MAKPTQTPTADPKASKPADPQAAKPAAKPTDGQATETQEKPAPEPRVAYTEAPESKEDRNAEGKLTRIPTGFDYRKHLAPKKADFVDEADFLDFRAGLNETRATELVERAARDRETAKTIREYGDPAQRAAIAKRQKLLAEVAALEASLKADGVALPPAPTAS